MTNAVAQSARLVAFEHSAPVVLRDVEDLHDADLDLVLADALAHAHAYAHASDATDVAIALARVLGDAPAALTAHDLGAGAAELVR